jgi:hypothetical protein
MRELRGLVGDMNLNTDAGEGLSNSRPPRTLNTIQWSSSPVAGSARVPRRRGNARLVLLTPGVEIRRLRLVRTPGESGTEGSPVLEFSSPVFVSTGLPVVMETGEYEGDDEMEEGENDSDDDEGDVGESRDGDENKGVTGDDGEEVIDVSGEESLDQTPNHWSRARLGYVSAPPSPRAVHCEGFLGRRMSLWISTAFAISNPGVEGPCSRFILIIIYFIYFKIHLCTVISNRK